MHAAIAVYHLPHIKMIDGVLGKTNSEDKRKK